MRTLLAGFALASALVAGATPAAAKDHDKDKERYEPPTRVVPHQFSPLRNVTWED